MPDETSPEIQPVNESTENPSNEKKNRGSGLGTFSAFQYVNFRWLFTGTVLTNAAQWIQQVTLSWLVYDLTGSGTMLGSINLVRALASLGIIPIAGMAIDRFDRRKLLSAINLWLFLITAILGIMLILGYSFLWALFIFSFLGGLARTFDTNLRQVAVFDLVPRQHTPNGVALIQTGWSIMRSFGPAIGGFLILWFGPGGNFLIQAVSYLLITVTITRLSFPPRKTAVGGESPFKNMKEGLQYVAHDRVTLTFTVIGFVFPLLIVPIVNILPAVYAEDVFHGGPDTLGLMMAAIGIGGIIGGFITASLGRVERRGIVQLVSLFILSLSLIGFAFSTSLWSAFPFLVAAGFFEMLFLASNQTLLQLSIPDNIRGRVTAVVSLAAIISPLGGIIAGVGSDLFGGPKIITIILASLGAVFSIGVYFFSPIVRNYRMSTALSSKQK